MNSETILPLQSQRLVLRRMQKADLEGFMAYRNDATIARFQNWESVAKDAAVQFIQEQETREALVPGQWLQIAITVKPALSLIGDCALKLHSEDPRQASIGITLARTFHGHGFGAEALTVLLNYLFDTVRLYRVRADTDPRNIPAWRLLERLGFRREGHLKQSLWFKGEWVDEYLYAILNEEWLSRVSSRRGKHAE